MTTQIAADRSPETLESLLDQGFYRAMQLGTPGLRFLEPLGGLVFDPTHAREVAPHMFRLCDEAEAWVRSRRASAQFELTAARRLARTVEQEAARINELMGTIAVVRDICRRACQTTDANSPAVETACA